MEPEPMKSPQSTTPEKQLPHPVNQITIVSKVLALTLFILLPFIGGYIGYMNAPEQVVEKLVVVKEVEKTSTDSMDGMIATTTIDMGGYTIRYHTKAVELIGDGGEVTQTIPWDVADLVDLTSEESVVISNRDINYDHYLDLGILVSVGYGGVNQFYHFYEYDPESKQLVLNEDLGTFESAVSNPDFNINEKTINSFMKSGPQWQVTEYTFDGDGYEQTRQWLEP